MAHKKAAGIIVFQEKLGLIRYLLLCNLRGEWGFPKGGAKGGETILETALRETKEETGIEELEFQKGFKEQIQYSCQRSNRKFWKTVDYFLALNKNREVKLSSEHNKYLWLPYQAALKKMIFSSQKEILKKAQVFLGSKSSSAKTNL